MRAILLILILGGGCSDRGVRHRASRHHSDPRAHERLNRRRSTARFAAQGGQSPAFEVQTGSVGVGTREANVAVPKIEVKRDKASVKVPSVEVRQAREGERQRRQLIHYCRALRA